jgi:hypothetical protein
MADGGEASRPAGCGTGVRTDPSPVFSSPAERAPRRFVLRAGEDALGADSALAVCLQQSAREAAAWTRRPPQQRGGYAMSVRDWREVVDGYHVRQADHAGGGPFALLDVLARASDAGILRPERVEVQALAAAFLVRQVFWHEEGGAKGTACAVGDMTSDRALQPAVLAAQWDLVERLDWAVQRVTRWDVAQQLLLRLQFVDQDACARPGSSKHDDPLAAGPRADEGRRARLLAHNVRNCLLWQAMHLRGGQLSYAPAVLAVVGVSVCAGRQLGGAPDAALARALGRLCGLSDVEVAACQREHEHCTPAAPPASGVGGARPARRRCMPAWSVDQTAAWLLDNVFVGADAREGESAAVVAAFREQGIDGDTLGYFRDVRHMHGTLSALPARRVAVVAQQIFSAVARRKLVEQERDAARRQRKRQRLRLRAGDLVRAAPAERVIE